MNYKSFFSSWSPEMAYLVGFIAADGYLYGKNYRLEFSCGEKDRSHLENIRDTLGCPQQVFYRKLYNTYCLRVHCKSIYSDLCSLGLHQAKSLSLNWIECPIDLTPHLIRGYFDGDGHISICKGKSLIIEILGTANFLQGINEHLFISSPTLKQGSKVYRIRAAGSKSFKFCEWIYSIDGLKLDRKFEVFQRAIIESPAKSPNTSMYVGVSKQKGHKKWAASARFNGKTAHLGRFENELDAARAYDSFIISRSIDRKINFPQDNSDNLGLHRDSTIQQEHL